MRLRTVYLALVVIIALAIQAVPGLAQSDKIRYRFCNGDGSRTLSFAYASYNLAVATTGVYGWKNISAGACGDVRLFNSGNWTHHFVFFSGDKQIKFGAPSYSWVKQSNESFCIDPKDGFEISETIFSPGRATNCRGTEVLVPFTFKVAGGYIDGVNLDLPAFSNAKVKEEEGSPLLNYLKKWF